ncbi:MAG: hypothetical protein D6694_10035 [Gammaproteobacteria bacterium]|nr:MAG: hypothetical protein D6694_10035 [Gammaproteobacteria bacterium]
MNLLWHNCDYRSAALKIPQDSSDISLVWRLHAAYSFFLWRYVMFKKLSFRATSLIVALVLALGSAVTAFATVITVDGNPSEWPGYPSCTIGNSGCALAANDGDEVAVPDDNDINTFWVTNSSSDMYFYFDTIATTSFASGEFVRICLDIPSQSSGVSGIGGCTTLTEVDRLILILSSGVRVADCSAVNCNDNFAVFGSGTPGSVATNGVNTEVGVTLSSLGLTHTDDGSTLSSVIFFDNNGSPADDNIPNSGTLGIPVGTGSPTAITLNSMSAASGTPYLPLALAGAAFVLVAGAGLALRKRYMA